MGISLEAYRNNIGTFQFRKTINMKTDKVSWYKSKLSSILSETQISGEDLLLEISSFILLKRQKTK